MFTREDGIQDQFDPEDFSTFEDDWDDSNNGSSGVPLFSRQGRSLFGSMSYDSQNGFRIEGLGAAFVGAASMLSSYWNSSDDTKDDARRQAEEAAAEAQAEAEQARKEREEAEKRAAEAEEARMHLEQLQKLGIEPDRDITPDELLAARIEVGYIEEHINIGVVGLQNEGKSTLVNAFRGLNYKSAERAEVGETELTRTARAYRDMRHPELVWHDTPGGGTPHVRAWGYYFNQRLFAYDKLVLVHSSTLTEMDVQILQVCKHREQEIIVVRSKADQHISNCQRNNEYETVESAREDFVSQVRADTMANNAAAGTVQALSPDYRDYIVCEMVIRRLVRGDEASQAPYEQVIDELELCRRLGIVE